MVDDQESLASGACFCGRGKPAASRPRFTPEVAARGGPWAARLQRCDACDLVFLDAEDAPLGGGYTFGGAVEALIGALWRRRADRLAAICRPGGRALDVGAGVGRLVNELAARGLDAFGLEPAPNRAAEGGARVGRGTLADCTPGSAPAQVLGDGPFDLVIFWHSLEHHLAPFADLGIAAERMRPGAALVIAVPNAGSWQARLAGPRWLHLDLPHHRAHFTPRTLCALVEDAGFEVERLGTGHVEMDLAGMLDAFVVTLGLPPRFAFDALRPARGAGARLRQVAGLLVTLLLLPFVVLACVAARLTGSAGTIRLVARRAEGAPGARGDG